MHLRRLQMGTQAVTTNPASNTYNHQDPCERRHHDLMKSHLLRKIFDPQLGDRAWTICTVPLLEFSRVA